MTRGFWGDRGTLRGDVLVALARPVGTRRLGDDRCRRLLVHPRPLGRHAQGRGQARRTGRGRERRRGASRRCSRRPRSACRTRSRARPSSCSASSDRARPTTTACGPRVAQRIAEDLGKPLKPEIVAVVESLPKTRSGKVMRRVIRAAWLGLDPGDLSALDDPRSLDAIRAVSLDR